VSGVGIEGPVGWLWRNAETVAPAALALAALLLVVRVGYLVALAVADLRLRWRGGDAAGQLADWLSQGVPGARGGRHSALYTTYLQTDAWRARRERTLLLAGYTCQHCGRAKATDAHHLTYDRLGCERDGDLLALCEPCHGALHGRPAGGGG
jgi:hypothetical protein